jgi:hypothetical protein
MEKRGPVGDAGCKIKIGSDGGDAVCDAPPSLGWQIGRGFQNEIRRPIRQ